MLPLEVSEAVDLSAQTPVSLDVGGSSLERDEAVLRHDEAKALHDEGGEWHAGGSNLEHDEDLLQHDEDNARRDDGGEEGHVNHQHNAGEPTFQGKINKPADRLHQRDAKKRARMLKIAKEKAQSIRTKIVAKAKRDAANILRTAQVEEMSAAAKEKKATSLGESTKAAAAAKKASPPAKKATTKAKAKPKQAMPKQAAPKQGKAKKKEKKATSRGESTKAAAAKKADLGDSFATTKSIIAPWAPQYARLTRQKLTPGQIQEFNAAIKGKCVRTLKRDRCRPNPNGMDKDGFGCEMGGSTTVRSNCRR